MDFKKLFYAVRMMFDLPPPVFIHPVNWNIF